jgi:hypothetical protein
MPFTGRERSLVPRKLSSDQESQGKAYRILTTPVLAMSAGTAATSRRARFSSDTLSETGNLG